MRYFADLHTHVQLFPRANIIRKINTRAKNRKHIPLSFFNNESESCSVKIKRTYVCHIRVA